MLNIDIGRARTASLQVASAVEEADIALAVRLARDKDAPLVRAFASLSEAGSQVPLLGLCIGMVAYGAVTGRGRVTRTGARMLGAHLVASGLKTGLKRLVSRPRPNVLMETGYYAMRWGGPNRGPFQSFPSGHTAVPVAVARALGRGYPETRRVAYAGAAVVALAQLPRGAHYPLDVAAGVVIGFAAESIVDALAGTAKAGSRSDGDAGNTV